MIAESQNGSVQRANDDAVGIAPAVSVKDLYEVVRLVGQGVIASNSARAGLVAGVAFPRLVQHGMHPSRTRSEVDRIS